MHQIDYSIKTMSERMNLVNIILTEQRETIEKYFGNKSTNILLQQLANNLLSCEHKQKHEEKMQENFENSTFELTSDAQYTLYHKITIQPSDYENEAIKEKKDLIIRVFNKYGSSGKAKRWIQDLKYDQVMLKQSEHGYIKPQLTVSIPSQTDEYEIDNYWKDIFEITSFHHPLNLDLFEVESWKVILKLLPYNKKISGNVDRLVNIFNKAYHLCGFTPLQRSIIREFQSGAGTNFDDFIIMRNVDISNRLKIKQDIVSDNIEYICQKMISAYEFLFTEYYYTFLVRGTYKKCSKCGENKLIHEFKMNPDSRDGRHSICKECEEENYKVCSKCGQKLNKDMFGSHPNTRDGLQSWCKICDSERKRK